MAISSWNAGIIRPIAVAPAGPYSNGAAPGVWTLDQATFWIQQGLWPIAGNAAPVGLFAGGTNTAGQYSNVIDSVFISSAGILGNYVGYLFGHKVGPTMFDWKENLFFKKKYLIQADEFYQKHGGRAIVIARFIPIIRTFGPILAGIVKMDKAKFMYYNVIGCLAWVGSMLCSGYFLQSWILARFNFDLKNHLEVIVLGIVGITTLPVIIKVISHRAKKA
jgi:membrane protein DedA with SNARE-associated domain